MGLFVINPGLSTTVQDTGTPRLCRMGRLMRERVRPELGRAREMRSG